MLKSLYYQLDYLYNYFKYKNKKIKLPMLEVWVGQICNLRCRYCCHLIPYVSPQLYQIDSLIEDCKRVFELCDVEYFSVVGGEPFTNRKIYQLLDSISEMDSIQKGKIVTNGTILPDQRTIDALKRLNGKLELHIDRYSYAEDKTDLFYECMTENGIPCIVTDASAWKWKELGLPGKIKKQGEIVTQSRFKDCWNKKCYTLANGVFSCCPRGITTPIVFHQPPDQFEICKINHYNLRKTKAMIGVSMNGHIYKEYCRYCLGMTAKNKSYKIPGGQI